MVTTTPSLLRERAFWRRVEEEAAARRHLLNLVVRVRAAVGRPDGSGLPPGAVRPPLPELLRLQTDLVFAVDSCPDGDDDLDDAAMIAEESLERAIAAAREAASSAPTPPSDRLPVQPRDHHGDEEHRGSEEASERGGGGGAAASVARNVDDDVLDGQHAGSDLTAATSVMTSVDNDNDNDDGGGGGVRLSLIHI